jgi:endonuclease/exonuclease/phosphatase family metal-dependent hydrolase
LAAISGLVLGTPACADRGTVSQTVANSRGNGQNVFFCFWNVENLFDDREDQRLNKADQEFDRWFARNPEILQLKLSRLSKALVAMNDGNGPDIIAIAEVEGMRAADLLRQALNARLKDPALHYQHTLMKEVAGGRHIATAILTRLPVRGDKTRLHGNRLRILEGHITVNNHDLVVVASHWTSRLTDKTGDHRAKYGDQIYGLFRAMYKSNPGVALLVCGDFNDTPDSPSVSDHLRAVGDVERVRRADGGPLLFNLFAQKDPRQFGTHYFGRNWMIFDQIAVSPGLLDGAGWTCDVDSAQTVNTLYRPNDRQRRPWRFGNEHEKSERGYSDHFPVTVRLRVQE